MVPRRARAQALFLGASAVVAVVAIFGPAFFPRGAHAQETAAPPAKTAHDKDQPNGAPGLLDVLTAPFKPKPKSLPAPPDAPPPQEAEPVLPEKTTVAPAPATPQRFENVLLWESFEDPIEWTVEAAQAPATLSVGTAATDGDRSLRVALSHAARTRSKAWIIFGCSVSPGTPSEIERSFGPKTAASTPFTETICSMFSMARPLSICGTIMISSLACLTNSATLTPS